MKRPGYSMQRFTVTQTTWSEVPALMLADGEAGSAALIAPQLGGDLLSLTTGGEELLRRPPDAHQVRMTAGDRWEIAEKLPTGRLLPAEGAYDLQTWQPLHGVRRDGGYSLTAAEADGWSRFELADRAAGRVLTLRAGPEYRHWVIFNGFPGFEGFVSPEPYTCMTNAFNLDLPAHSSGMAVVGPGEGRPAGSWELNWAGPSDLHTR